MSAADYRDNCFDLEAIKAGTKYYIEIKASAYKGKIPLSLYEKSIVRLDKYSASKGGIPVFIVCGLLDVIAIF